MRIDNSKDMSHAPDDSGAPGIAPARPRWIWEGLAIAASGLVTGLAFLTPADGTGMVLRVAASALTLGLVVHTTLRLRRTRAAARSSPWASDLYQAFIDRLPVIGYIVPCDTDERVFMSPR